MKRIFKILGIIFLTMFVLMIGVVFAVKSMNLAQELPVIEINNIDINNISDGAYFGEYDAGLVKVAVKVQVKDHSITEIVIERHDNGLGKKAEKIVDNIINQQSLNVEVVSGATISSKTILKAVESALTSK